MKPLERIALQQVLSWTYMALVVTLLFFAVEILRMRCESFGCMGVAVSWIAWVIGYVPALALGLVLRSKAAAGSMRGRIVKGAVAVQVLAGASLVVLWAARNAG